MLCSQSVIRPHLLATLVDTSSTSHPLCRSLGCAARACARLRRSSPPLALCASRLAIGLIDKTHDTPSPQSRQCFPLLASMHHCQFPPHLHCTNPHAPSASCRVTPIRVTPLQSPHGQPQLCVTQASPGSSPRPSWRHQLDH
jgi:hypothetical protein